MPQKEIERISLANHLALVVCRGKTGDPRQLSDLARAIYLTYYLQGYGYGDAPVDLYQRAKLAVDSANARGRQHGIWTVDASDAATLEEVLRIQDQQLAVAPVRTLLLAQARLEKYSHNDDPSPIPEYLGPVSA